MAVLQGRILRKKKRYHIMVLAVMPDEVERSTYVHIDRSDPALEFCYLDAIIRVEGEQKDDRNLEAKSVTLVTSSHDILAIQQALEKIDAREWPLSVLGGFVSHERVKELLAIKFRERRLAIAEIVRFLSGKEIKRGPRIRQPRISIKDMDLLDQVYQEGELGGKQWQLFSPKPSDIPLEIVEQPEEIDELPINLPEVENLETLQSGHKNHTRLFYLHGKKQPQVRWMVQRIKELLPSPTHVLDVGGGRGDLASSIALAFEHTLVTVVDKNKSSLEAGRDYAEKIGVGERMNFVYADFMEFVTDRDKFLPSSVPQVDLVVGLHACGDLSDLALSYAKLVESSFMVCPCCYTKRYLLDFEPTWYTCIDPNDLKVVRRLAEINEKRAMSRRAITVINSMRLNCFSSSEYQELHLEEYEDTCSLRNMVLIGNRIGQSNGV